MELALDNCMLLEGDKLVLKQVVINSGKISEINEVGEQRQGVEFIYCNGNVLLPGLIDAHVHFRVPGGEHKEDWISGSKAALAGGITTVVDMPNTSPSCTTQALLNEKKKIAERDGLCNSFFHFGASNNNAIELEQVHGIISFKIFLGSSTGDLLVTDEEKLKKIFSTAKERNMVVAVHAEDEEIIQKNIKKAKELGWNHAKYHSSIRDNEAEFKSIEKALSLQSEIGNRLHVCHVSTKEGIELIRKAKQDEQAVTCEVTPHHLFLDESATEELGNFAKMNPSLKSKRDVEALWKGVRDGTADLIATDHAPHTLAEKEKNYWEAPSGVPGCETLLPLLLNAVNEGKIGLKHIIELCCENPAKLYGLKGKGFIKEGMDADLVLVDLKKEIIIENGNLFTKCNWSPFSGWSLKGVAEKVFVQGKEVGP
ncbi:dihydroorotase [Candidatus Micrarchaeota archaeon]|nr:dihydroorotase [Candidatus Micrarchaeota archaeon]